MVRSKKIFVLAIVLLLVASFVLVAVFAADNQNSAKADSTFVSEDEIVIAHITDTHYYPLNYCYNGNHANTDYYDKATTSTKLFMESSLINAAGIASIKEQKPDYLVVTGDISFNGEIQAHIEMANLLRKLQNEIRAAGKPGFQVFVVVGNHDMYNSDAVSCHETGASVPTVLTTRYDITKIYSSLGYPDMTNAQIEAYYDTLSDVYYDNLPYEGHYVNSTTAPNVRIEYQYIERSLVGNADYGNGDITYVAYCPNNYVFIGIDEEISGETDEDEQVFNHIGGLLYETTRDYLTEKKDDGKFDGKNLVGMMHHNAVPHFALEDSLLKDFTIYSWQETTDFLADLGMRFIFTGHMHSNDIATHCSFNGNYITDIETSSLSGYKGAVRYAKLSRGSVGSDYAENFATKMVLVPEADFTAMFTGHYAPDGYLDVCKVSGFIEQRNGKYICTDPGQYAVTKLFLNIVSSVEYDYLRPQFLSNLGEFVSGMFSSSDNYIINSVMEYANVLINNLVVHLEDVVLKDYTYGGTNEIYKANVRGAKLGGYLSELVDRLVNIKVNTDGTTLFDFGMGAYLKHVGGLDTTLESALASEVEALASFKDGTTVKTMFDMLLDEQTGLLRLVKGLLQPIDLAYGMSDNDANDIAIILGLVSPAGYTVDPHAVVLDNHVPKVLDLLKSFGVSFDMGGLKLGQFLDKVLNDYITDSFYTSLGEIAYNIMYQFSIDEGAPYENNFSSNYVTYLYDNALTATYVQGKSTEAPSVANGKLPSMLTVTFGENPQTDKSFVWFTDRRVTGTQIQYCEGSTFAANKATTVNGTYKLYATTTANIDLGVFATLMHVEVGYHTVELTGLKAGTTYSYRVGSAADGFWSENYTFKTAPADKSAFELLLITDIQGSANNTYETAATIMSKVDSIFDNGYDFVINCGDVVDNSRNLVQWQYFLNTVNWGNTTQVVANGNHDEYAYETPDKKQYSLTLEGAVKDEYNYLLLHYNLSYPEQNDTTGAYYSFDYSAVHFVVLNTNDLTAANKMTTTQIEWLKKDLQASTADYTVVIMHKGIYTSGAHSTEADVVNMRAQLTPIFADNGVNLVLQGHDHTYSESYYLDREGNVLETEATGSYKLGLEGTLYITLGTFGDKFYDYVENEDVNVEFGKDLHEPHLTNPTFGKLVFDGQNLYYYGYEYDLETGEIIELRAGTPWYIYVISIGAGVIALAAIIVGAILVSKKVKARKLAEKAAVGTDKPDASNDVK